MKKLLNTLFVTSEDAYLTLDGENVVVNREKQVTARFPLHALAGIISFSYAGASPALMGACVKRDVSQKPGHLAAGDSVLFRRFEMIFERTVDDSLSDQSRNRND